MNINSHRFYFHECAEEIATALETYLETRIEDMDLINELIIAEEKRSRNQKKLQTKNKTMFKELSPEEETEFREWARKNYKPFDPIKEIWHPVIQEEAKKINQNPQRHKQQA